jgi:hypothetical protein
MHAPFPKHVPVLLFSALAVTFACSDSGTSAPTAPSESGSRQLALTVEPAVVTPQLVGGSPCFSQPAFRTPLVVVVSGPNDFILRSLRFSFTDPFGGIFFPIVMPTSGTTATQIPSSLPLSVPGTLTVPGTTGIQVSGNMVDGVLVRGGFPLRVPVLLEFGCGTQVKGNITVTADTMTRSGSSSTPTTLVSVKG